MKTDKSKTEDFTERLKLLIGENSIKEFSKRIGWHIQATNQYLEGVSKPSYEFFVKLKSKYPEVDLNWLLTGEKYHNTDFIEELYNLRKETEKLKKWKSTVISFIDKERDT